MASDGNMAPPLRVAQWFNTDTPVTPAALRGRVVVLHAFQMLCPACVSHGLPQAVKVHHAFSRKDVAVLGLHTVFEHHAAMAPHALQAFLGEYRIPFPVGVDQPSTTGPIPATMAAYGMRGTPSLVVLDRRGVVRLEHFGRIDDMQLGALLGALVAERMDDPAPAAGPRTPSASASPGCDAHACATPADIPRN